MNYIFERMDRGFDASLISKELEIELNKEMSKRMATVRDEIKAKNCLICGKKVNSFCRSHYIPKYCLDNIASEGKVLGPNSIIDLPSMGQSYGKKEIGVGEAGTFSLICRECDKLMFEQYENPDNYSNSKTPTQRMLLEITTKNYLKFIYKRKSEIALYEGLLDTLKNSRKTSDIRDLQMYEIEQKLNISRLDLESYMCDFNSEKNIYMMNRKRFITFSITSCLIMWHLLPFKTL